MADSSKNTADSSADGQKTIDITVEFGGGMEVLFSYKRSHKVALPARVPAGEGQGQQGEKDADIRYLIHYLVENMLTDKNRTDLFAQGETVRPGILVLVNDTDWELEGELDYKIQPRDSIMFISSE